MKRLSHGQLAKLVKSAQHGNTEAFATLYAATVESQLYFATAFLKDPSLAEDVIQTVYLSIYQSLHKLENPQLFVAYLNRICYNACIKAQKKSVKHSAELYEDNLTYLPDEKDAANPANRYLELEQSHAIYKALAVLPEQQQAIILMRYFYGLKIPEIAQAVDCSESTVKRQIKAAVTQLKILLQN